MTKKEFILEIDQLVFILEIVKEEKGGYFLFCKPKFESNRSFFMNKDNTGNWRILYRDTVPQNILSMELILSEKITDTLKGQLQSN